MLEILQFVFQDFWHWAGTLWLVSVIAWGISGLVRITVNRWEK